MVSWLAHRYANPKVPGSDCVFSLDKIQALDIGTGDAPRGSDST